MCLPLCCAVFASSVMELSSHPPHCHFPTLAVPLSAHSEYVLLWEGFWVWPLSCSVILKLYHLVQNEFCLQFARALIGVATNLVSLCLVNFILMTPCECFIEFTVNLELSCLWLCRNLPCAVAK
jgi:hypothetical protein